MRGSNTMVVCQPSKLNTRVRFPSPAHVTLFLHQKTTLLGGFLVKEPWPGEQNAQPEKRPKAIDIL